MHFLDLAVLGEKTRVARRIWFSEIEDGDLGVEADGGAGDERLLRFHAGAVEGVAGGEVVGAVEDDVDIGEKRLQVVRVDSLLQWDDLHIGIQRGERGARSFDFLRADGIGAVKNLPLQVSEIYFVRIGKRDFPDAACGEVEGGGAAEAAGADDQRVRCAQPLLALDADFLEQDVAAVAEELLVVQVEKVSVKFSSTSLPAWSARPRAPA